MGELCRILLLYSEKHGILNNMSSLRTLVKKNFKEEPSEVLRVLNDVADLRSTSRTYLMRKSLIDLSHGNLDSLVKLVKECRTPSDVQYFIRWARQIREFKFQDLIALLLSILSIKALKLSLEIRCEHGAALLKTPPVPTQLVIIPIGDDEAFITSELNANLAPKAHSSMQQFKGMFVGPATPMEKIEDLMDRTFVLNDMR